MSLRVIDDKFVEDPNYKEETPASSASYRLIILPTIILQLSSIHWSPPCLQRDVVPATVSQDCVPLGNQTTGTVQPLELTAL